MSTVNEELPDTLPRWEIPSDWQWVSIVDVGKVITGNTPPTKDESNYGDHIPFVKPPALVDRGIRSTPAGLSESGAQFSRTLPAGAVLVSCIGGLGKTGIAKVPVAFNQQINAIVFDERVIPEFGFYYAQTLKPWLHGVASATTLPIVNKGKFQRAPFPLAPLDQQKRIVAEIEKQFSRLDEAVANLKRVKANLKRYKAAILKAAVEGRLVETEAELARREGRSYETGAQLLQRILETRRSQWQGKGKYKEPAAPDTTDLPELPEGWVWTAVEQLGDVGTGATPLRSRLDYYEGGKIPWITSGALNEEYVSVAVEYITELAVEETNAKVFPAHMLLVAMYGEGKTRGKVSELLIDAATNQACAAIVMQGLSERVRDYTKLFFLKNYDDI
jgi:type I restriction enzyme S subunit